MSACCIVAIDGYAACGKSTLAKQLSSELEYLYIDTGAMYRSISLYFMRRSISWNEEQSISEHLPNIQVDYVQRSEQQRVLLNGEDVTDAIRSVEVNSLVSDYAKEASIRSYATALQQSFQHKAVRGIVMEGRDIGTTVFPNAQVKLFLVADMAVRAKRRYDELQQAGQQQTLLQSVQQNLLERDAIDEGRENSPLKKAADAYEIDNTLLTVEQQKQEALLLIKKRCS